MVSNRIRGTLEVRVHRHVRKDPGGHWYGRGAGQVRDDAGKRVSVAHALWLVERGDVPPGMIPSRTCDAIGCLSPWHRELRTPVMATAKLTPEKVAEIRAIPKWAGVRGTRKAWLQDIAREVGVHPRTLSNVRAPGSRTWRT